jgi:hypothetical protein
MQRLITFAAIGLLIGAEAASREAWAQGSPTSLPPGGANTPANASGAGTSRPAGTTGTARPPGAAGTARPAGSVSPAGTPRTAQPATRLQTRESFNRSLTTGGFGTFGPGVRQPPGARTDSGVIFGQQGIGTGVNSVGFGGGTTQMMFERNPGVFDSSASPGNPATGLPGRPNQSGGSASRTLRPGARMLGDANDTSLGPGSVPLVAPTVPDALFLNGMRSTFGLPITPIVPIVPLPAQGDFASEAAIDSAGVQSPAPAAEELPIIVTPQDARVSARAAVQDRRTVTPREPPPERMGQVGTATATAFPTRRLTSPGDAEEIARPLATSARGQSQIVEVPTTPPARPTAYVRWQGYWWSHNPQGGWHYWDGSRWSHFAETQD